MAEQLNEESANREHNIADINKLISECAGQMIDIKEERKALNERAGKIRTRLRDAGVQTKAFEFALKVSSMEPEAKDEYLDSLKVNFMALGIGAQGDLFPADQPAAA